MMAVNIVNTRTVSAVSFNMHGFNQGVPALRELILCQKSDIFLLQEHWLLQSNLCKFSQIFPDFCCYGSSAMNECIEGGLLRGRPFGGVAILVANDMQEHSRLLLATDRYCIIRLFDCIIVNVYLPCVGTPDRMLIIDELLNDVANVFYDNSNCKLLFGGDLNCDLDHDSDTSKLINSFATEFCLKRCDKIFDKNSVTYVNTALNCQSHLDYFLSSDPSSLISFDVFDDGCNISDHLPILLSFTCAIKVGNSNSKQSDSDRPTQSFLRWDHGDRNSYYAITGQKLQAIMSSSLAVLKPDSKTIVSRSTAIAQIEFIYNAVIKILQDTAAVTIPTRKKNFYKFWWNEELDILKEQSMRSHQLWLDAGKPRCGPIACNARACKMRYKQRIAECQKQEVQSYTNDLHDALLQKEGAAFWRCWRAKFD